MSFMEPQVEFGSWYEIDGPMGTEVVPADIVGDIELDDFESGSAVPKALADYCENRTAYSIQKREGWGARLSAPGYLDCTEWSVFDTEAEARDHLEEMYGGDDDDAQEG
jgi:hypothetical protein